MVEQGEGQADHRLGATLHDLCSLPSGGVFKVVDPQQHSLARDGRDKLQHLTGDQFVLHLHQKGILCHLGDNPGIFPLRQGGGVFVIMSVIGQPALMEGQAVAAIAHRLQLAHIGFGVPVFRVCVVVINRHAVGTGDDGAVVFRLAASLNLETVNADLQVFVQLWHDAEIFGIEDVGAARVFLNRHQLTGAAALFQQEFEHIGVVIGDLKILHGAVLQAHAEAIVPAAGIGAIALIGTAFGHKVRQQAAAGIGHAHGPMYKGLQLDIRAFFADLFQLRKRNFAGQNAEISPLILPEFDRQPGADIALC